MNRLTPATVTMIMLLVVGGLVVAYVAKGLLATEAPKPPRTLSVPMPIKDLEPGHLIREEDLGMGPVGDATRLEPDVLMSKATAVGRVVMAKLARATPIRGLALLPFGQTLPLKVSAGKQALSLDAGAPSMIVDGLIKPGDYLDVKYVPEINDVRLRGGTIYTLLKGIRILAINRQYTQTRPEATNNLTLEVTPLEANVINLAKDHGKFSFTYNPNGAGINEFTVKDPDRMTLEEVLRLEPLPKQPEPEKPFKSTIYRQTGKEEMNFDKDGQLLDANWSWYGGWNNLNGLGPNTAPTYPGAPGYGAPGYGGPGYGGPGNFQGQNGNQPQMPTATPNGTTPNRGPTGRSVNRKSAPAAPRQAAEALPQL